LAATSHAANIGLHQAFRAPTPGLPPAHNKASGEANTEISGTFSSASPRIDRFGLGELSRIV